MDRGNEVLDKGLDVIDLLLTVRQIKTYIKKNHIDWKKLEDEVPKDEAKRVLKIGDDHEDKNHFRVKKKKEEKSEAEVEDKDDESY